MSTMMPSNWELELEQDLKAPDSPATMQFFDAWAHEEHGSIDGPWGGYDQGGAFNPFDTTLSEPGATDYNSVGVKNYTSEAQGLEATASTLEEAPYATLLADIRSGASLITLEEAEDASPWGTAFPDVPTLPPSGGGGSSGGSSSSGSGSTSATLTSWWNPFSWLGDAASAGETTLLRGLLEMLFIAIGGALIVVGGYKMAGRDLGEDLRQLGSTAAQVAPMAAEAAA